MHIDIFPIGAILLQGNNLTKDKHWLLCDGSEFMKADYAELFNIIGYKYGGNENDGTFKVPNYMGEFLRGASIDPQKGQGTFEYYSTKLPTTPFKAAFPHLPTSNKGTHGITKPGNTGFDNGQKTTKQYTCTTGGDLETRPKNVSVNYYIKAY